MKIRCPLCKWEPQASSRWVCATQILGCGHVWNTFDTRGVCPKCAWKWEITACLRCHRFSPHEDWYEGSKDGPGEGAARKRRTIPA